MNTTSENFLSGFGSLIAAEQDLRDQLRALIAAGQNEVMTRTLQQHVLQFETIIQLLEKRDQMLPHPRRFEALDECTVPAMNSLRNLPRNLDEPLGHLVTIHQTIRRGIEALIEQSGHHDMDETSLRDAAKRHLEMEHMLTELISNSPVKVKTRGVEVGNAAGTWENEGGGGAGTQLPGGENKDASAATILPS